MDPFSAIIGTGLGIIGSIFGAGGPSPEQKALTQDETNLMVNLGSMTNQRFAQQSQTLNQIQSMISNPAFFEQPGMSAQEYSSRQAGIISSTNQATTAATQRVLGEIAGRGGGTASSLIGGPEEVALGSVAVQGAIAEAGLSNELTAENYAVGRQLGLERLKGAEALGQLEDPSRLADAAANIAQAANAQANTTAAATNAQKQSQWGGVTSSIAAGANALGQRLFTQPVQRSAPPVASSSGQILPAGTYGPAIPSDYTPDAYGGAGGVAALGAGAE